MRCAAQVGENQGRFLDANRREARRDSVREGPSRTMLVRTEQYLHCLLLSLT